MDDKPTAKDFVAKLTEMNDFIESIEAKYGPSFWRPGLRNMTDNGDGTLTIRRPSIYTATDKVDE